MYVQESQLSCCRAARTLFAVLSGWAAFAGSDRCETCLDQVKNEQHPKLLTWSCSYGIETCGEEE